MHSRSLFRFCSPMMALLFVVSAGAQARDLKIGVVDMGRVFKDFYKTAQANARFESMRKDLQREKEAMEEDFKRLNADYQKVREEADSPALSEEVRQQKLRLSEERLEQLRIHKGRYDEFLRKSDSLVREQMQTAHERILKELSEELQKLAKEENFDLVLDRSSDKLLGLPPVLFSKDQFDITDALLKRLNAKAPTDAKPSEEKPAEKSETPPRQ